MFRSHQDIPAKANRILHFILIAMLLILIRLWHLSFIQYDQRLEESRKPQRKTRIEPATRATIRDRFNLPLAVNKLAYEATILYSQLREIPAFEWRTDPVTGKRAKIQKRRAYIRQLSSLLASELGLEVDRIEDLIHSKAAYYSQVPFVLKEDLTEKEYYRLRRLEKEWPGIHTRSIPKRYYPRGRVAADVIGYMGAIQRIEYEKILHEMRALEQFIEERENEREGEELPGFKTTAQARRRLRDLEAKAYTLHDYVGKTGIEGAYEERLRGFYGKRKFLTDSKGNFLRELPGSQPPLPGQRILLTLSAELQEYAEQLLAQNEALRVVRKSKLGPVKKTVVAEKEPWIKGGAIVVMDPQTADLLALASYPRFDPNDFILFGDREQQKQKKQGINRWFENEGYLARLWNQQQPLERERYDEKKRGFYDEKCLLSWQTFLRFILPSDRPLKEAIGQIQTLRQAIDVQRQVEALRKIIPEIPLSALFSVLYEKDEPEGRALKASEREALREQILEKEEAILPMKQSLDRYFLSLPHSYDQVLLVDLCRLAVDEGRFSDVLLAHVGDQTLEVFHDQMGSFVTLQEWVKEAAKQLYHDHDFKKWREKEEKNFLRQKRLEEKQAKSYPKPYLDYLDQEEQRGFQEFWKRERWGLLLTFLVGEERESQTPSSPYSLYFLRWYEELAQGGDQKVKWRKAYDCLQKGLRKLPREGGMDYLKSFRPYDELTRSLLGRYRSLRPGNASLEKHLASAFYPAYGFGYGRSHAYRQSAIQGSLFKLVTAYAALVHRFKRGGEKGVSMREMNPLVIVDRVYQQGEARYVGETEEGQPIPQLYKGGRLPRSLAHQSIGRVDLIRALEFSSNPYFALLAGECLEDPEDLAEAARLFSYGARTGIDLPGEIAGRVPTDLKTNRTGLYAMAIGQHSLVVTPLQTAVMLATLANGGKGLRPKMVKLMVGRQPAGGEEEILSLPVFPYQESLSLVGLDFPLFSAALAAEQESAVQVVPLEVKREIFMPEEVRQILLKGLRAVTNRSHQENLTSLVRLYREHPEAIRHFTDLKDQLLGKTSTSESVENMDLDFEEGTNIYTHVWFGSIAFQNEEKEKSKAILLCRDEFGQPELIVVVYLRYGGYGKEAAPLAAQMVKKWREITQKRMGL